MTCSLGYMPPVNQMVPIGQVPRQQPWFPTELCTAASVTWYSSAVVDPSLFSRRNIRIPVGQLSCCEIISLICSVNPPPC